jgi:hypothetical protein
MGARTVLLVALALAACGGGKKAVAVAPPPDRASCRTTHTAGNGELQALGLPPDGVLRIERVNVAEDGSLYTKLGWFRAKKGELHITGQRIDAPSPPLRAESTPNAPDDGFEASGLTFSSQGCWRVTGRIGDGRPLSFVTFVVRR